MRHARAYGIGLASLATLVAAGAVAFAQSTTEALPEEPPVEAAPLGDSTTAVADLAQTGWGDPDRGASLAGTCAACHGLDGKSTVRDVYPSIAGHGERYIAEQLARFKSGERQNAIMQPFAAMLSAQDMRDLGAHFAAQSSDAGIADDSVVESGPYQGMKFYEIGQKLYRSGDVERSIPACMACHSPTGAGNPGPAYPHVGGQVSWYTARRLQEYRDGETGQDDNPQVAIMAAITARLTDQEIQALASYMEGLHPRPDAAMRAAMAAAEAAPAAAPAAPADAGDADQATDEGEPLDATGADTEPAQPQAPDEAEETPVLQ